MIIEKLGVLPLPRRGKPRLYDKVCPPPEPAAVPVFGELLIGYRVRHRFRATFSRQPRQVRKEATVTGSFVCSGAPVPGFSCLLRESEGGGAVPRRFSFGVAGRGRPALH